ncbi:bifunctional lysylphosphatidylglycerol flippase/synthetase MprF [Nicoliella spurrieriana]|uniref:Bifunctional lysylphosphatidylglycerol flippase/synthetase MprF n=1 Tax=Nicoliella spurrieriana TaxID=2925830 RepID=A0A976RSL4_9LACO|nr:bifunctional lysylphosphatidylglycerol flippase/synthetase MprF [Nicoliella spurrieriana]UQS87010.1 bifunctional lysylphosphatidylglycerol flippase/synthetase MprF [Nicoliella spurrieriana]
MKSLYQKTSDFFVKHLKVIKTLFIFSVLIFSLREFAKIISEVNGHQVRTSFDSQSPTSLGLMLILGLIAVLPMLVYDFTIVKFLPGKFKPLYIVKTGWITNAFTNILGFGGLIGASLRANFYNEDASPKQIMYAISKIAMFLLAGLSTYCWIALIMIFGFDTDGTLVNYWPFLFAGALYFPIVFIVTRLNNSTFFQDLTLKRELTLILGSCLEWGSCAALFLIIGSLMHVNISLISVFPLFIIANIMGVIGMTPGGLGGFDVTITTGLIMLGVDKPQVLVWLAFYRIFYYVVPFIIALILFIHDYGKRINEFLDDIPKTLFQRTAQIILTIFLYFSGIMLLLSITLPNVVLVNSFYLSFEPYTFYFLNQLTTIIVAFILIGLARGYGSRVQRSFWPTVVVLLIAIANTLWKESFPINMSILSIILILLLWLSKGSLYRKRLSYSWGQRIMDTIIFAFTFTAYTFLGIYNHFHHNFHNGPFKGLFKQPNAYLFPSQQVWFAGFLGLLAASLILVIIYRYFSSKETNWLDQPFDAERVRHVIDEYGGNEVSHLAFVRDKQIYFYTIDDEDQVFFMFKRRANKLVIMGEPVGNAEQFSNAIDQFMIDADQIGLSLVFYEVGEKFTMILHEKGFDFTKAGEEGMVELSKFTLVGKKHRGERALMHKFEREGYQFSIVNPPFDNAFMAELKAISDQWLNGNSEKGFSLGYFDAYYLNQAPIAIMKDKDGKVVAFANIMPTGEHAITSIDLMRSSDDAPSGIMDGIFINLFQYSLDNKYQYFNLGMAPLSNVGRSRFSFIDEKIANLVYKYGQSFYSFQGLRSYKEKYVNVWVPRYIVYRRKSSLIFTMLQILLIVNERIGGDKPRGPFKLISQFSSK